MHFTPSNTRLIIGLVIAKVCISLIMIFIPFPMGFSLSFYSFLHNPLTVISLGIQLLLTAIFCVVCLYLIALLKFASAPRFTFIGYYLHIAFVILMFAS